MANYVSVLKSYFILLPVLFIISISFFISKNLIDKNQAIYSRRVIFLDIKEYHYNASFFMQYLLSNLNQIIKSDSVLGEMKSELKLTGISVKELKNNILIDRIPDTSFIEVIIKHESYLYVSKIDSYTNKLLGIIINDLTNIDTVNIIDSSLSTDNRIITLNDTLKLLISNILVWISIMYFIYIIENRYLNSSNTYASLNMPVLGLIPSAKSLKTGQ